MYIHPDEEEGVLPFYKYLKIIAGICCVFSICILIDFILPGNCVIEEVEKRTYIKESNRFGGTDYDLKLVTPSFKIKASPHLFDDAKEKTVLKICYSPVLKSIRNVSGSNIKTGAAFSHDLTAPVYRGYGAFPIVLLLLGIVTLFFKEDTISYGSGILTVVVLITMLVIL